jgi:transcription elongation factor Elf1
MLSGKLLPAHPKPLPNEVLSSWFARVAEANAVKQHTLAAMRLGATKPPWSWSLDLKGGEWFLQKLCEATGTALANGEKTTLFDYSGVVFPQRQQGGRVPWVLPTRVPLSNFLTEGIQFCPTCLSEGALPYFRRQWRLAFFTYCPVHNELMFEACPSCGAPIAYHRHDCSVEIENAGSIANCYMCGVDYRAFRSQAPEKSAPEVVELYNDILMEFQNNHIARFDLNFFRCLHQLCMVMTSRRNEGKLREFIYSRSGLSSRPITNNMSPFSWRGLTTRHHVITLALWLMLKPLENIKSAWKAGAVRYASLVRDMDSPPGWYDRITCSLNRQHVKIRNSRRKNFTGTAVSKK